ncbi:MAG TPA: hypothetical protein VKN36_07985 [Eudoraea sp.]|nr:hypothetical protein [Eudoraea sp.]
MIDNILYAGGIGCVLFTIWLILFGLGGWVRHVRDKEGKFRKKWNWQGVLGMTVFAAFLLGVLVWGNLRLQMLSMEAPGFTLLFLNSFGIFFMIHLYDLIVIDYLLIVLWHPKLLNLPNTEYYTSIWPHIKGFAKGIPLGLVASGIAAMLSLFFS